MEEKKNGASKGVYIIFTPKQIVSTHKHTDATKIDKRTGEVMEICAVRLPSKAFRNHLFGKDSKGIERDEREATINVLKSYIYDNKDKNTGDLVNHFVYLDPDRNYNINFKGKLIGQEDGKNVFDKPERATLTGEEVAEIYAEAQVISKQKQAEKEQKKEAAKKEKKEKTQPKEKAKKKKKAKAQPTR